MRISHHRIVFDPLGQPEVLLGFGDLMDEELADSLGQLVEVASIDQSTYARVAGRKNQRQTLRFTRRTAAASIPGLEIYQVLNSFAQCYWSARNRMWGEKKLLSIQRFEGEPMYFMAGLVRTSHRQELTIWETPESVHEYELILSAPTNGINVGAVCHPILSGFIFAPPGPGGGNEVINYLFCFTLADASAFTDGQPVLLKGDHKAGIPDGLYILSEVDGNILYLRSYVVNIPMPGVFGAGGCIAPVTLAQAPPPVDPPNDPELGPLTALSTTEIQIQWEDVGAELYYRLERSLDGIVWDTIAYPPADATSTIDTGLQPGTLHYYRIAGVNLGGRGAWSTTESESTLTPPPNTPPVVAVPLTDQTVSPTDVLVFAVPANSFTDADNDPLTYTAALVNGDPLPAWLIFDAVTQEFSGEPGLADAGTISVRVTVSDGQAQVTDDFQITVTNTIDLAPQLLNPLIDQTAQVAVAFSYQFDAAAFSDPNGGALTYTAALANGSALPGWLSIDSLTRTLSGTPDVAGVLQIRVIASTATKSVSDTFDLTIS